MSTPKLILFGIAWVFAALTIGVVTAIVATELLSLVGIVQSGQSSYDISLNTITFVVFLVLVAVPVVFRKRFADVGEHDDT
ncbi:MAG: hypothetical protein GWP18_02470 [Proteobacteria bacterium]|nr:hypothetical protein [Pseudomonadota bacterium]